MKYLTCEVAPGLDVPPNENSSFPGAVCQFGGSGPWHYRDCFALHVTLLKEHVTGSPEPPFLPLFSTLPFSIYFKGSLSIPLGTAVLKYEDNDLYIVF